ncbi:hypothetical protein LSH36_677g04005 [Paralvinella palmiformis]|uniref:Uncharacterized protein n=1 Tax=Paralvinella palmiformis TaxID=53620 RepID=A0AAD9J3N7_9ANNE|nr:hypothetical protein LSH36_677g04005 [Paralvinella palmiformis]
MTTIQLIVVTIKPVQFPADRCSVLTSSQRMKTEKDRKAFFVHRKKSEQQLGYYYYLDNVGKQISRHSQNSNNTFRASATDSTLATNKKDVKKLHSLNADMPEKAPNAIQEILEES